MIRVIIIEDKRIVSSVFPNPDESTRVAWAQENEKNCGYCVFNEEGEIIELVDREDSFELLIRSTLNHLDLQGKKYGFTKNKELFDGVKKLGFTENGDKYEVDISEFFKPCCCNKNN